MKRRARAAVDAKTLNEDNLKITTAEQTKPSMEEETAEQTKPSLEEETAEQMKRTLEEKTAEQTKHSPEKETTEQIKISTEEEFAEQTIRPRKRGKTRRVLLRVCIALLAVVLLSGAAVFSYDGYTKTHYEITFYQETSKKVSRNIRLLVIADIHNREYGKGNETLISDVRALKPDVILFAGDMVNRRSDDYENALRLVRALKDIAPCYGVMGNHENERIYYEDDSQLPARFEEAGLKLLRNAEDKITLGADTLQLIGVEGTKTGFEEYGGRKAMEEIQIDPKAYSIVMAHIPILFDEQLSAYDFDLGIAGHTHGGLVNIPSLGGLYSDEEGFFPVYYGGRYTLQRQQTLLISRGLGDSRPIPRVNNMPELMVIDINWF